jgi:cephalosporin hydroxylase
MLFKKKSKSENERVEITIDSIFKGHHKVTYRGIEAIRCPFDYVIYQMIISELKPDLIIEVGTNKGGGALYIADLLNILGHGIIHTIDITKQSNILLENHPRIKLFTEGWENYDVKLINEFEKILVIEDSSHTFENTFNVLEKFAPVVSKNSYLIVEDGIINELGGEEIYNGGPLRAIREFLSINKDFIVDRERCNLFGINATFNVNGYLKKIS